MPSALSSTPVNGVASGVMAPQVLGGPIFWYFVVLEIVAVLLALYVVIDSRREVRRSRIDSLPEPSWLYRITFVVYLVFALVAQIPGVPVAVPAVWVLLTPLSLALSFAYLPKPTSQKDSSSDGAKDAPDDGVQPTQDQPQSQEDSGISRNNGETLRR